MIEINLLPREMRKARGLRVPRSVVIAAAAGAGLALLLIAVTAYQGYRLHRIDGQITEVRRQADKMKNDIMLVDRLVDVKSKVLARLAAIEQLDGDREQWVMILEDLSQRIPEFLWLTSFKPVPAVTIAAAKTALPSKTPGAQAQAPADSAAAAKVQRLTVEGFSFTLNGLANFLINLNESDYFGDIALDYAKIVQVDKQQVYNFSLRCRLEEPPPAEEATDVEHQTGRGAAVPDSASSTAPLAGE